MPRKFNRKAKKGKKRKRKSALAVFRRNNLMQEYHAKIETWYPIVNTSGAAAAIGVNFSVNFPTYGYAASYDQITNVPSIWNNLIDAFVEYKVHAVKMYFLDNVVNTTSITDTSGIKNVYYVVKDPDDAAQILTEEGALTGGINPIRYATGGTPRQFIMMQPKVNRKTWLQTGFVGNAPTATLTGTKETGLALPYASIKCFFPVIPLHNQAGIMYVTWYCSFRSPFLTS